MRKVWLVEEAALECVDETTQAAGNAFSSRAASLLCVLGPRLHGASPLAAASGLGGAALLLRAR